MNCDDGLCFLMALITSTNCYGNTPANALLPLVIEVGSGGRRASNRAVVQLDFHATVNRQLLTNCITDGQHLTVAAILLVISSMQAGSSSRLANNRLWVDSSDITAFTSDYNGFVPSLR